MSPTADTSSQPILVSVVIAAWNGAEVLPRCLEALAAQTLRAIEVIIVDNGSAAGLPDISSFSSRMSLRVERLTTNRGFAAANNIGARIARGNWLALLNQDAFPQPDWLESLIAASERHPGPAFFASRLIRATEPSLLDGAGDAYHVSGMAWRRGHGETIAVALDEEEVFSACAAAALYPREDFLRLGGFDEDFFCYHEDVDLGFRLRLQGCRCWYVPSAVVLHVGESQTSPKSDFVIYQGHRNMEWTFVKNMPTSLFWRYLPAHLMATILTLGYYSQRGHARAIWRAKLDALRGIPKAFQKRKEVQRMQKPDPSALSRLMDHALLGYYRSSLRQP